jgi:hypothetical protein
MTLEVNFNSIKQNRLFNITLKRLLSLLYSRLF